VSAELKKRKLAYKTTVSVMRQRAVELERVRADRTQRFMHCFQHVAAVIDQVYKVYTHVFLLAHCPPKEGGYVLGLSVCLQVYSTSHVRILPMF